MSNNYLNPNFNSQYPYQINGNNNVPSKGLENIKSKDNMAGKIADNYDPSDNLGNMSKSFLYSLLMSTGFVRFTNWLMTPKNITDTMTQADFYKSSRLYKIGAKLDNFGPLKWLTTQAGKASNAAKKIPLPQFIKEMIHRWKVGSVAPWDTTGMYSLGKQAEAMKETVEFFSKVGDSQLRTLSSQMGIHGNKFLKVMEKVKAGKIDNILAYKKIAPILERVNAKTLKEISANCSKFSKLLGTTFDLNLSLAKAKFFAGRYASGPVGKVFNKLASLVGEASGGGVLGGRSALFMNAFGLMSGFNSMLKAEKGDKLAAFMEDYIGLTLGGYLMSMTVGKWFNSAMGWAENGMNHSLVKNVAKRLEHEGADTVEKLVIAYNNKFKQFNPINKVLAKLNKGNAVSLKEINKLLAKAGKDPVTTIEAGKEALTNTVGKYTDKFFNMTRKRIAAISRSKIKFKSIFKGSADGANLLNRAGRWFVQKPAAIIGKFLSTGRYTLLKNGNKFGNFARWFKRAGGGVGRMILVGFILVEPFRKAFVALSHKIFGKPKNSIADDNKNPKPEKNPKQPGNNPIQPQQPVQPQNRPSQNLVDLYLQNMPKEETAPVNPNALKTDTATYIPNQLLTQESYVDTWLTKDLLLRRDIAVQRADAAEKYALEIMNKT